MGATMTTNGDGSVRTAGPSVEAHRERLTEGADRLARARSSILAHPQLLVATAAALMTAGISAVLLGWLGAAHSTYVEEQLPYLISGGLLGVALSVVGGLLFFAHWLTVSIKEDRQREAVRRQDHEELMEALRALHWALARQGEIDASTRSDEPGRPLRRAPRRS